MRRISRAIALGLALCGTGLASASELELDRVVAVVGSDVILASELDRRVAQATVTKDAADPRKAMLWAMIDELLMVQLARETGIEATDAEVDRAIGEVMRNAGLDRDQLLEELVKQGYSLADYRRAIRHQILALRIMNLTVRPGVNVTDADVKKLFDERVKAAGDKPVPKLEDVKEDLRAEIYQRQLDLARDRLAVELRARAFIDIRLPEASK